MEEEEPNEEVEPMEEGELHVKEESNVVMEPLRDEYLSDPSLTEPRVQAGSDFEMWCQRTNLTKSLSFWFSWFLDMVSEARVTRGHRFESQLPLI